MTSQILGRLESLAEAYEKVMIIHSYRSMSSFRAYCFIFVSLNASILGPLFARYSFDHGLWAGIYVSILCSAIYTILVTIFFSNDDPFDGSGLDDISLRKLANHNQWFYERN